MNIVDLLNQIDVNVLSLVILGFIFFDARKRVENAGSLQHRLFISLGYVLAILLFADSLGRVVDGTPGEMNRILNTLSSILLYVFESVGSALWFLYAAYQVTHDAARLKKPAVALAAIVLANTLVIFLSIDTGWCFTIDSSNIYHRGPWFIWHMLLCFVLCLFPLAIILKNRDFLEKRRLITLALFPVPTLIGTVLQCMFYGTSLIWCCMTVSMLFIYLNIQAERLGTDYLTGVFNRRQMDKILKEKMESKQFSAVLVDIDGFKQINDKFGHSVGDQALSVAATLLKRCLRRGDHVARFGGDEFLIILDIDDPAALEEMVNRLRDRFYQYNQAHSTQYSLSFSAGYAVCEDGFGQDPQQFLKHIDKLMYLEKQSRIIS